MKHRPLVVRSSGNKESEDFVKLVLISSPYFPKLFGENVEKVLKNLFIKPQNLFSFENVHFLKLGDKNAGMLLSYDWRVKRKCDLRTGMLLLKEMGLSFLKRLPLFVGINFKLGKVDYGEYYISNVAVFPEFRGMGFGKILVLYAIEEAKRVKAKRVVLEVERENTPALGLYQKLGFKVFNKFSVNINGFNLNFYRMVREL